MIADALREIAIRAVMRKTDFRPQPGACQAHGEKGKAAVIFFNLAPACKQAVAQKFGG